MTGRDGKSYPDWTGWKKGMHDGAEAAFEAPDPLAALYEFFEANAVTVENFGHTDTGRDGGMNSFGEWRERILARAEQSPRKSQMEAAE